MSRLSREFSDFWNHCAGAVNSGTGVVLLSIATLLIKSARVLLHVHRYLKTESSSREVILDS